MESQTASRRRLILGRPVSYILVAVFLGAYVCLMESFTEFDWGRGVARALLLAALGCLFFGLFVAPRYVRLDLTPNGALKWFLIAGVAALFALHLVTGVNTVRRTVATDAIALDQGQSTYRAIQMLLRGWNPYDRAIMLDHDLYNEQVRALFRKRECLQSFSVLHGKRNLEKYWRDLRSEDMAKLFPELKQSDECAGFRIAFGSLGYKYGPGLLAVYFPFVYLFGKAGIYVCHLLLFLILFIITARFSYEISGRSPVLTALSLLVILAPTNLRHNTLDLSATDLGPTLAAIVSLMLLHAKRERSGALCLALSVAAKLLPGLLYAPLLLFIKKRNWLYFAVPVALLWAPFLIHDFWGMANNLFLFNIVRSTDGTSLVHFLPRIAGPILSGAVALVLLVMVFRMIGKKWSMDYALFYLLAANLGVLLAGRIFHNNYLIWLTPLFAVIFAHCLKRAT